MLPPKVLALSMQLVAIAWPCVAHAQGPPLATPKYGGQSVAAPAGREPTWSHGGLYARASVGLVLLRTTSRLEQESLLDGNQTVGRITYDGFGSVLDLLVGYMPGPGLALGGGILAGQTSMVRVDSAEGATSRPGSGVSVLLVGPFADFFHGDPTGLHLGALVGPAWIGIKDRDDKRSFGGGLLLRSGYAWRVADRWSLGADLTAAGAWSASEVSTGNSRETTQLLSLMVTMVHG